MTVEIANFADWSGWAALQNVEASEQQSFLLIGKGPSYALLETIDSSAYITVGLNHVLRERYLDIAHIIDIDVLEDCAELLLANAGVLLMPWIPHRHNKAGDKTLPDYCEQIPQLAEMAAQGRVFWYNLYSAHSRVRSGFPVVPPCGFSAAAVLNLLAQHGAMSVRSVGVDGGDSYTASFADLEDKTLLTNGRQDFSRQFQSFAETIATTGVDYAPLGEESPIRVFVGMEPEQELAYRVLCHSIRQHASCSLVVERLHQACEQNGIDIPRPKDPANAPRTPFSFQRFAIPDLKQWQGRGIYLDSDMLVFEDIAKLWMAEFSGADLLYCRNPEGSERPPQFAVMLLDCEALQWKPRDIIQGLDRGDYDYQALMGQLCVAKAPRPSLSEHWNSLEHYSEETALLHYTDMSTQPWLYAANPLGYLWCEALLDAIAKGAISRDFVAEEITRGHVRPSLLVQIDRQISEPLLLPWATVLKDVLAFTPPHARASGRSLLRLKLKLRYWRGLARWRSLRTGLRKRAVQGVKQLRQRLR